jgi:hypothetical protein
MREYVETGRLPKGFRTRVKAAIRRADLEQELRDLEALVFDTEQGETIHYFPTVP